ncbi:MAG: deoxyribonuclease [Desulfurococcales archaeon ex4484_58]|nr:MAG: deoxyribonuclease [Desulfurococcales archaeon ex4484_58]
MKYVDMHCHCHELPHDRIREFLSDNIILVCVSDNVPSSYDTLELSREFREIIPCIGIHPWEVHNYSEKDLENLIEKGIENNIECLGEVGLDKLFYARTYDHQMKLFKIVIKYAKEYDLVLNLHTAGTWKEVYELLIKNDISRAYFHWYTGSLNLLNDIISSGYYIGLNPAWKIQDKHRRVLEKTPLDYILTESDSPYKYRGLELSPSMIRETIEFLAEKHGLSVNDVVWKIWFNFKRLFGF